MSEIDHLSDVLRERLHALVADIKPSDELMSSVAAIPATHGRRGLLRRLRRRRIAIAVPVPIAAIATAAVLMLGGATPTASLGSGITWLPNGDMRLPDSTLEHPAAANADIRRHHVHNFVVVPMTASCPDRDFSYTAGYVTPPNWPVNLIIPKGQQKGWIVVQSGTLLGRHEDLTAAGRFRPGHVPRCASTHGWGQGMGDGKVFKIWPAPEGRQG